MKALETDHRQRLPHVQRTRLPEVRCVVEVKRNIRVTQTPFLTTVTMLLTLDVACFSLACSISSL